MSRINLGDLAREVVSGYEGIVTARVTYLTGCDQIALKKRGVRDTGETYDTLYFDEPFVELIEAGVVKAPGTVKRDVGGPAKPMRRG